MLLTATPTSEFRVWNSGSDWSNEKWTNLVGRLKTSVWSPDGNTLLFATENDCVVYAVDFKTNWESGGNKPNSVQTAGEARAVLDVSVFVSVGLSVFRYMYSCTPIRPSIVPLTGCKILESKLMS